MFYVLANAHRSTGMSVFRVEKAEKEALNQMERLQLESEMAEQARIEEQREQARIVEQREQARIAEQREQARIGEQHEHARITKQHEQAWIAEQCEQAWIAEQCAIPVAAPQSKCNQLEPVRSTDAISTRADGVLHFSKANLLCDLPAPIAARRSEWCRTFEPTSVMEARFYADQTDKSSYIGEATGAATTASADTVTLASCFQTSVYCPPPIDDDSIRQIDVDDWMATSAFQVRRSWGDEMDAVDSNEIHTDVEVGLGQVQEESGQGAASDWTQNVVFHNLSSLPRVASEEVAPDRKPPRGRGRSINSAHRSQLPSSVSSDGDLAAGFSLNLSRKSSHNSSAKITVPSRATANTESCMLDVDDDDTHPAVNFNSDSRPRPLPSVNVVPSAAVIDSGLKSENSIPVQMPTAMMGAQDYNAAIWAAQMQYMQMGAFAHPMAYYPYSWSMVAPTTGITGMVPGMMPGGNIPGMVPGGAAPGMVPSNALSCGAVPGLFPGGGVGTPVQSFQVPSSTADAVAANVAATSLLSCVYPFQQHPQGQMTYPQASFPYSMYPYYGYSPPITGIDQQPSAGGATGHGAGE